MKRVILLIFLLTSLVHIGLVLSLPAFIPEQTFPYHDLLYKYFKFYPVTPFANFDGYQYISIAKNGYSSLQQSYFPLYPGVISLVSQLTFGNYVLGGVVASWIFFFLGLWYFYKLATVLLGNRRHVLWALSLLAVFPTAYYYQVVYTESFFLFLSAGALFYLYKRQLVWAAVFAIFASLAKVQGALLVIPFLIMIANNKGRYGKFLYAFAPLYGLALYAGYLGIVNGDPFYFYHAQSAFGAERSVDKIILLPQVLYRYLKIFLTSAHNFAYWISLLEFTICIAFVAVICYELFWLFKQRAKNLQAISLQAYSLVVLLLPTLTGTLTSLPRYALISFGFFIVLARLKFSVVKVFFAAIFLLLHIVLFVYFLKGYFIS